MEESKILLVSQHATKIPTDHCSQPLALSSESGPRVTAPGMERTQASSLRKMQEQGTILDEEARPPFSSQSTFQHLDIGLVPLHNCEKYISVA